MWAYLNCCSKKDYNSKTIWDSITQVSDKGFFFNKKKIPEDTNPLVRGGL